ncbi:MAG: 4Fe-4S binding protein [Armatimonadetes bacterium]|nr:4Fe-4S binding protein [Armatimonadota bacterium]
MNTVFDGEKCVLCGGCVDVCPEFCLKIVTVDRLTGEPNLSKTIADQLGGLDPDQACAIIKDESICIRCGLCAERCPTGAITMERFSFEEVPLCPSA